LQVNCYRFPVFQKQEVPAGFIKGRRMIGKSFRVLILPSGKKALPAASAPGKKASEVVFAAICLKKNAMLLP